MGPFPHVTLTEHGAVCTVCGAGLAVLTGPDAPFEHDPDCEHWKDES